MLVISLLTATDRSASQPKPDAQLISLSFRGGTALEYVNAIRKAAGEVNIVAAPEAGEVPMPAVTIKQVTVAAAVDLLDGRVREMPGRQVRLDVTHMPVYHPGERQTYQVQAKVGGRAREPAARVWTVSDLLANDIASAAVLSAVETALDVIGSTTRPDVRFHEDTALLIASGDHDQLGAIEHVLDSLQESVDQRREDQMRLIEMQLAEIDHDRQMARARLAEAQDEARNARQETIALRQEMARLETMSEELKRMLETKDRELTAAMADLRALQIELQRERSRREPGRSDSDH
jgi:hypothetical protein